VSSWIAFTFSSFSVGGGRLTLLSRIRHHFSVSYHTVGCFWDKRNLSLVGVDCIPCDPMWSCLLCWESTHCRLRHIVQLRQFEVEETCLWSARLTFPEIRCGLDIVGKSACSWLNTCLFQLYHFIPFFDPIFILSMRLLALLPNSLILGYCA